MTAIKLPDQAIEAVEESIAELKALCYSAGGDVVASITQSLKCYHPGHLFGEGKLEEIKQLCIDTRAQLLIYDGELSPSQQEKLERCLDIAVIDRPALILDIFARHARSREAKTQVELAQLQYILPRLAGHWTHLERQEAAIGTRGPGETQLETDRRMVYKKIGELKKELEKIDTERNTQRKRRGDKINFCLVGYTNAGKSSLFNSLTGDAVLVADRLFATLDSTTRRVSLKGIGEYLLTDTVGFIKKLPVNLVASFRSTLKEAVSADMLIHVVDFAAADLDENIRIVNEVLDDIGAGEIKRLLVFNKIDLVKNTELRRNMIASYPGCKFVSAKTGEGIDSLRQTLVETCDEMFVELEASVSPDDGTALASLAKMMQVYSGHSRGDLIVYKGKILRFDIPKLERLGVKFEYGN